MPLNPPVLVSSSDMWEGAPHSACTSPRGRGLEDTHLLPTVPGSLMGKNWEPREPLPTVLKQPGLQRDRAVLLGHTRVACFLRPLYL